MHHTAQNNFDNLPCCLADSHQNSRMYQILYSTDSDVDCRCFGICVAAFRRGKQSSLPVGLVSARGSIRLRCERRWQVMGLTERKASRRRYRNCQQPYFIRHADSPGKRCCLARLRKLDRWQIEKRTAWLQSPFTFNRSLPTTGTTVYYDMDRTARIATSGHAFKAEFLTRDACTHGRRKRTKRWGKRLW